jgi:hypothetical protein
VSVHKAKSDYGVVLDSTTFAIDETATKGLRARMKKERLGGSTFTFGSVPEPIGVVRNWVKPASGARASREAKQSVSAEADDQSILKNRRGAELESLPAAEINSTILPL